MTGRGKITEGRGWRGMHLPRGDLLDSACQFFGLGGSVRTKTGSGICSNAAKSDIDEMSRDRDLALRVLHELLELPRSDLFSLLFLVLVATACRRGGKVGSG